MTDSSVCDVETGTDASKRSDDVLVISAEGIGVTMSR